MNYPFSRMSPGVYRCLPAVWTGVERQVFVAAKVSCIIFFAILWKRATIGLFKYEYIFYLKPINALTLKGVDSNRNLKMLKTLYNNNCDNKMEK